MINRRLGQSFASHACTRCASRKIKCNRRLPTCEKCIEACSTCVYVTPPPRRRRKKVSGPGSPTTAKLRQYEDLLHTHGIHVPNDDCIETRVAPQSHPDSTADEAPPSSTVRSSEADTDLALPPPVTLDSDAIKTYGKNELWTGLTELRGASISQPLAKDDQSLETDGDPLWRATSKVDLQASWPQPDTVRALWHTYVERFHPIYKILHAPSVALLVDKGAATFEALSAPEQALLYAIFAVALYTVPDPDECIALFGEHRLPLLRLYRTAARDALSNANYLLTMDIMVLQAYVIFLRSLRYDFDSSPLWTLTGIAIRNAKRMGLDQVDEPLRYSPLETQERRLLWFILIYFDAYIAEVAGVREPWIEFQKPVPRPFNLNDSDLHAELTELPPEREGATDVMFTVMRCDWIWGAQKVGLHHLSGARGDEKPLSRQAQDRAMDEVEDLFARKYVRHCDPTIPMHFWILLTAKGMMVEMRLSALLHRRERGAAVSPNDSDALLNLSLKALEYEYMGQNAESLKIFHWHMTDQIPRVAVTWLAAELCKRTVGKDVDAAWLQLEATFSKHPELINHIRRPWILQLGAIVLEAWQRRETSRQQEQLEPLARPKFITELHDRNCGASGGYSANGNSSITKDTDASFGDYLDRFDPLDTAFMTDDLSFDFAGMVDGGQWSVP